MHFDGVFDNTQIGRDLLVETPRCDVLEHLPFAGRKRAESMLGRAQHRSERALRGIDMECFIERGKQLRLFDWLVEHIQSTGLYRAHTRWDVCLVGQKDDRAVTAPGAESLLNLQTVHPGEREIENDASGGIGVMCSQKLLRRTEGPHLADSRLQHPL